VTDFPFRVLSACLRSELIPAFLRMKIMRTVGFRISSEATIWPGANLRSRKLTIESGVFINVGFYHDGYDYLHIGRNVRIGPYVRVLTASHEIGPPYQRGLVEVVGQPVRIEDGCWVGASVTILPGIVIEPGCVIAAGAVLTKSTTANGLYAGVPARRVQDLDS
jgi:maltose O-acetyltransferase